MKKIFYPFTLTLFLLTLAACDDWTEPEAIGVTTNTLESVDPELYAEYTRALRAYKASDHRITYATYENVDAALNHSHRITSLPDSLDFVELMIPDPVAWVAREMEEVRRAKGTRFILRISRDEIIGRWNALQEAAQDPENPEEPEEPVWENYGAFEAACVAELLGKVEHYGYDGICVSYSGSYTEQMTQADKEAYLVAQELFVAPFRSWLGAHSGKLFFFEVMPQFVADKEFLASADYVIFPTRRATRISDLSFAALRTLRDQTLPQCKFLYTIETIPFDETDVVTGRFASGGHIEVASDWMTLPDEFDKSGLVIWNAQRDYFTPAIRYSKIRSAINTMNPNS